MVELSQIKPAVMCLLGPTASGKTELAIELCKRFPLEIISVDSAMVYRGMDIGTAKPEKAELAIAPHRLINLNDPSEPYSAGNFYHDAFREIEDILAAGKVPLLVGGTMLYFRVLLQGIAKLPKANPTVRQELLSWAQSSGWPSLHAELIRLDPDAAQKIHEEDGQRIQRALEVFLLSGKTMTSWQKEQQATSTHYQFHSCIVANQTRANLHEKIALRFEHMLAEGFVAEVEKLYQRGDLTADLPSIRSVGYRQMWRYLSGELNFAQMQTDAICATRQLAKRQMTWLRSWPNSVWFDAEAEAVKDQLCRYVEKHGLC